MSGEERKLEALTHRAFRELPLRRAPVDLERRVWEALERRASRPWWRRGFAEWPATARAALVACCCASAAFVLFGLTQLARSGLIEPFAAPRGALAPAGLIAALAGSLEGLQSATAAARSLGEVVAQLLRMIPPEWLRGALLGTGLLYLTLFSLIAIGYSTLYLAPDRRGVGPT
jgi:hypothetical protein